MKLIFEVKLGNVAMQSLDDAVGALERAVGRYTSLGRFDGIVEDYVGTSLTVHDSNGNTVGSLSIIEEEGGS